MTRMLAQLLLGLIAAVLSTSAWAATYSVETTTFSWETTSTNVVWNGSNTDFPVDDDFQVVNLGFTFDFAGVNYTQVRILSNGALQFGADTGFQRDFGNEALPITNTPNSCGGCSAGSPADRVILPYWDDLEPSANGSVRYQSKGTAPNRYFVATWESVQLFNTTGNSRRVSVQAILRENGDIVFQYNTMGTLTRGASATIGVEVSNTDFTEFSFNQSGSVVFGTALRFFKATPLDHIRISHDGSGLTCSAETVTVTACADAACSAVASTDVAVTLSPGGWVGGSSFTIPAGSNGGVTRNLSITSAQTVTLGTSAISPTATNATRCFVGAVETCQLTFADSGFVFDVPNHVSDTSQSVTVSAVKKDDAGQACVPGFASVTRTLDFYSNPINPTSLPPSGAQSVRVGGTAIAGSSPGTGVALNFNANGQASTTVSYADAGTMRLFASYTGSAGTGDAGLVMTGQDDFIARPNDLVLSVTGNPAATVPADPVFTQAGTPFAITVTARNASGNATSNFGRETAPASVTLATTLVAPVGGLAPAITADPGFGAFSAGSASGNWSWSEVGIISLLPQLVGGDYLGAGNVTGVSSGNIGRFVPHHFTVTGSDRCGSFSYAGQPFSATVSAASVSGALTQNYAGSYAKEVTLSRAIGTGGTLAGNVIATTPGLFSAGTATLDKTVIFTFDTPPEPPLVLSLRATDSDGVTSMGFVEGGTEIRSGRLRLVSGFGSGLAPLTLPLRVESWQNIATLPATVFAWATETTDTCTAPLLTTGSFTVTGIGTTVSAASLNPDGTGSLTLTAPGSAGQADITACLGSSATAPVCATGLSNWLQFDWNGDGSAENPTARAGFELNPGNQRQIYRREVIN